PTSRAARLADQPEPTSSRNRRLAATLSRGRRASSTRPSATSTRRAADAEIPLAVAAALSEPVAVKTTTIPLAIDPTPPTPRRTHRVPRGTQDRITPMPRHPQRRSGILDRHTRFDQIPQPITKPNAVLR